MGYSTNDESGNRIAIDDDGRLMITPKNKSTKMYTLKDVIKSLEKQNTKDDCGRDYVKRTGKCPICTDCPHNCPLEK